MSDTHVTLWENGKQVKKFSEPPQWPQTNITPFTIPIFGELPYGTQVSYIETMVGEQMFRCEMVIAREDLERNRHHLEDLIRFKIESAFASLKDRVEQHLEKAAAT